MVRCNIIRPERCHDPVYDTIKVKVQHEDSGRITTQTWTLCKEHWIRIHNDPNNFHTWYRHKEAIAVVLEIIEVGLL